MNSEKPAIISTVFGLDRMTFIDRDLVCRTTALESKTRGSGGRSVLSEGNEVEKIKDLVSHTCVPGNNRLLMCSNTILG